MWKSVFIESCILSALIFGGFYLNTAYLKNEISHTKDQINLHTEKEGLAHISGKSFLPKQPAGSDHVSGNHLQRKSSAHISGDEQTIPVPTTSKNPPEKIP
jgi:hypothetical protein